MIENAVDGVVDGAVDPMGDRPARPAATAWTEGTPARAEAGVVAFPATFPARALLGPERADAPASNALDALAEAGLQDVTAPWGTCGALAAHALGEGFVWVQDARSRLEFGHPSARGVWCWGIDPSRIVLVRARHARDTLWAMEEAVRAGLGVLGEIEGDPRALDFTATRRLELFSRASGVRCVLVRTGTGAARGSSGARWRWHLTPHSSAPDPHDARAPGTPRWELALTRARMRPPGRWIVEVGHDGAGRNGGEHDGAPRRLRVVAALADGGVAAGAPTRDRAGSAAVIPLRPGRAA